MKQIIILLFSILFISCGSRKVVIDKIKKDSLSQIVTKIATKEDVKIETKNNILSEELIITPFDSCKDIVIDGKTYRNVTINYKKTKDNSLHIEKKTIVKNELKKELTKTSVKEFKKDIDKKANYFVYLWLLLIPIIIYLFKKLKSSFFF